MGVCSCNGLMICIILFLNNYYLLYYREDDAINQAKIFILGLFNVYIRISVARQVMVKLILPSSLELANTLFRIEELFRFNKLDPNFSFMVR
uniref:Uncharacterized protein n=1 Tax=Rhodnius prolixus TaxID=13249 RepID=T1HQ68_RHOPR